MRMPLFEYAIVLRDFFELEEHSEGACQVILRTDYTILILVSMSVCCAVVIQYPVVGKDERFIERAAILAPQCSSHAGWEENRASKKHSCATVERFSFV